MNKPNRRLKVLLTAAAFGVCCAYAQTASPGGFVLPDADPDAAPYGFLLSKTDDGMSVSLTLNRIDRTITDSVAGTCTLGLGNVPKGLCITSMIVDGRIVSSYKLIKQ